MPQGIREQGHFEGCSLEDDILISGGEPVNLMAGILIGVEETEH